jgi:hypothetical protein
MTWCFSAGDTDARERQRSSVRRPRYAREVARAMMKGSLRSRAAGDPAELPRERLPVEGDTEAPLRATTVRWPLGTFVTAGAEFRLPSIASPSLDGAQLHERSPSQVMPP